MLKDDRTLDPHSLKEVQKRADLLLRKAGLRGVRNPSTDTLLEAAELQVERDQSLDGTIREALLNSLPNRLRMAPAEIARVVKRATEAAVSGMFFRPDRMVFVEPSDHPKRQRFTTLHEIGHDFLPHQRKLFQILEDCEASFDPGTEELFEREANVFASEVMFNLELFANDARDLEFGQESILKLSKVYGASTYATYRRYVVGSGYCCAVLAYNADDLTLRRLEVSSPFSSRYGKVAWPLNASEWMKLSEATPRYRQNSRQRFGQRIEGLPLTTLNGELEHCDVQAFCSGPKYQCFFLIYPSRESLAEMRKPTGVSGLLSKARRPVSP